MVDNTTTNLNPDQLKREKPSKPTPETKLTPGQFYVIIPGLVSVKIDSAHRTEREQRAGLGAGRARGGGRNEFERHGGPFDVE